MGAEADQVQSQGIWIKGDVSEGLGCIAMHRDALLPADLREVRQWLQHADFIVGGHHAHHHGVCGDRLLELCRADQAIRCRLQQCQLESLPLKLTERVENSVVFGDHADEMARSGPGLFPGSGMAEQGKVVGFGGAAGEHHPFWLHAEAFRQLSTCQRDRRGSAQPQPVLPTRGIAPLFTPVRLHCLNHFGSTRRGRLVIKGKW